jgi:hypothetical protein
VDGEQGSIVVGPLVDTRAHRWVVVSPPSGLSAEPYPHGPQICARRDPLRRPPHVRALEPGWERGVDGLHNGRPSESGDSTPPSDRFFFL